MTKELKEFIKENQAKLHELSWQYVNYVPTVSFNDFLSEVMKEPILVTEDGYEVTEPECIVLCVNPNSYATVEYTAKRAIESACTVYFMTEEARTKYVSLNKPLTSVKEQVEAISALMSDDDGCYAPGTLKRIEDCLTALAQSKLK